MRSSPLFRRVLPCSLLARPEFRLVSLGERDLHILDPVLE